MDKGFWLTCTRNKTTKHMRLTSVPFKKTLNKAYQKVKPTRPEIEAF